MTPRTEVRHLLESAYADFHSHFHRARDPVCLVHEYPHRRDREVAGFFAALLAYGNVRTILNSVREILAPFGPSPHAFLLEGRFPETLGRFRHRFTTGDDLRVVFAWLTALLRSHGSLEAFFVDTRVPSDGPMKALLSDFVVRLRRQRLSPELERLKGQRERNLKYLVSDPEAGSACKRLNMYLRWMVRADDGIDLGAWRSILPSQLMLPVDTHLLKALRTLRWTRSKQATWKVVEEATARLRLYSPADPIRYDFSLCHLSMAGENLKRYREALPSRGAQSATVE